MNKPAMHQPTFVNKPFVLICLFTVSTLAATIWNGDANAGPAAAATIAAPTQMAGDEGRALPVCGMRELSLSAQCQPSLDA
ncbi:hypothetical protein [Janthinobacterium sp.]|uniref:hypothetical protein n=1 Tax=Janthinobacterium sp. TaxID=1871054 RepID=UPI0028A0BA86|nr:hypothetical protein [Janthinobacterium sp.]